MHRHATNSHIDAASRIGETYDTLGRSVTAAPYADANRRR
jgi:hypothetical protein